MIVVDDLKALSKPQRAAFVASFLGWTLDAFDFTVFLLIMAPAFPRCWALPG